MIQNMNIDEKLSLIRSVGQEIINEEELKLLLSKNETIFAYDGFEPSGQIHIAQGLIRTLNINKLTKTGIKFKMLIADWHAYANNKMGGDLAKIQTVGKYFIEVWKACSLDIKNVEFVWASDLQKQKDYWKLVLQVGKSNALKRFVRTAEMMGREESLEKLTGAHIIYSCMQVADIFSLNASITQLGMDQRKVNMLAREVGPMLGFYKPVVISHHMLAGLLKPQSTETDKLKRTIQLKMSKSNPDSAIFMTDSKEEIERKIAKAWAPEGIVLENPVLEYCKYLIFEKSSKLIIERPEKFGGQKIYDNYNELQTDYEQKLLHPMDLKTAVAKELNSYLIPVRNHFEKNAEAKKLLEMVKSFEVTR